METSIIGVLASLIEEHIHKYMRVKLGDKGFQVFKCMKAGCTHYVRAELVVGNYHECWRCGVVMVMNQWSATFKKPHCRTCTRDYKKKKEQVEQVA